MSEGPARYDLAITPAARRQLGEYLPAADAGAATRLGSIAGAHSRLPEVPVSDLLVTVRLDDGRHEQTVSEGTTAGELLGRLLPGRRDVVAARIDGALRDLAHPLTLGAEVEPVPAGSPDGRAIVRHSTAHVLAQAVQQPPAAEQRDGFARSALYANQTMKDFVIERAQSYRRNGVDWHEIVARAVDVPSNKPIVVSQTIRFAPDGYLRAVGIVREDQRDGTLSKFRQIIDSVQIK